MEILKVRNKKIFVHRLHNDSKMRKMRKMKKDYEKRIWFQGVNYILRKIYKMNFFYLWNKLGWSYFKNWVWGWAHIYFSWFILSSFVSLGVTHYTAHMDCLGVNFPYNKDMSRGWCISYNIQWIENYPNQSQ